MYKNFKEYNNAYLKKYYMKDLSKKFTQLKIIRSVSKVSLLITPFLFICILTFLQSFNKFDNSKKLNIVYSESINDSDLINTQKNEGKKNYFLSDMISTYVAIVDDKHSDNISINNFTNSERIISDVRINESYFDKKNHTSIQNWKDGFSENKIEFISMLLPIISFQNQHIIVERERLFKIYDNLNEQKTLPKSELLYLNSLAKKYLIDKKNKHKIDLVHDLLESVDIIPTSIVLAQAANESGWGKSRFAKEYNALFGQYTYDESSGVIPYEREDGKKHLIKNFSSIDKSVESYFININTHYAYKKFRNVRSGMDKENLNIKLLTSTLDVYAEDEFYVDTINSIIESNNFTQFDPISNIFTSS